MPGSKRLMRHSRPVVLRLAATPHGSIGRWWPDPYNPASCRVWLAEVWAIEGFQDQVRAAAPGLAATVDALLAGQPETKTVRRVTDSVVRYLLRANGRAIPFGLFAGVTTASLGQTTADVGSDHRAVATADTGWAETVASMLVSRADVLPHLTLQTVGTATRHGNVLTVPRPGGQTAMVPVSRPLNALLALAATPVPYPDVVDTLTRQGGTPAQVERLVRDALGAGVLSTSLHSRMTVTDPLAHIVRTLKPVLGGLDAGTAAIVTDLDEVLRLIDDHNTATPVGARHVRDVLEKKMSQVCDRGKVRLSVNSRIDATVAVSPKVAREAERAAHALMRLSRHAEGRPEWSAYHAAFWDRYGAGTLVPLRDAVDLAAGVGFPHDFPTSPWPEPATKILDRDEHLTALAQEATISGTEVLLTDDDIERLACTPLPDQTPAPHAEMSVRVHAPDTAAVDAGDFTLTVRPAWSAGTLTGRFAELLGDGDLIGSYRDLPTMITGALLAQLSFTPVYPHAQNVARIPQYLPYVIPVGEHRYPSADVIGLDDLAVTSTGKRLLLVSLSRRRVVEPVVLHPLALEKQAPPLARFIAMVSRGAVTGWTEFDWGPAASRLPHLPRVRYGRSILSPARWTLDASALPGTFEPAWHDALREWARTWRCPTTVDLRDKDRTLRLDLTEPAHARILHAELGRKQQVILTEAPADDATAWIGHAHDLVLPLVSTRAPEPHPHLDDAPVISNTGTPTPNTGRWVQAKIFTTPVVMNHILTSHLPALIDVLDGRPVWFVRYRNAQEDDHLRVRVAATGDRTEIARAIDSWFSELRGAGLASRLVYDTYRPETGRYGSGPIMDAAETVFVADSDAVRAALTINAHPDRRVTCALGMLNIARGFLGDTDGLVTLSNLPTSGPGDHDVTRETIRAAADTSPDDARTAALRAYRMYVDDTHTARILESLVHMHHNRFIGPDRPTETIVRHAAAQTARSLLARQAGQ
ncbi:lantibiotic dehydratase [Myceligenerans pegani]|uniref:Lantibiotic dehydratase n=1 Tax=Myceligenerans pegani TaxID=2776917 RepID=A0ABR9N1G1_9MICO|nr:lantibiotic dehydratase [Myceligenerans sp. TRM 65318]MBE1877474.1 lantibiotic dehydratase [Myceligenerans sp. TRM 65318]MBE3019745.1 lantibiotic dehydratase [Myceligenerans sp. TRM 65318]